MSEPPTTPTPTPAPDPLMETVLALPALEALARVDTALRENPSEDGRRWALAFALMTAFTEGAKAGIAGFDEALKRGEAARKARAAERAAGVVVRDPKGA